MTWKQFATGLLQQFLSAIVGSATEASAGAVKEKLTPKREVGKSGPPRT